MQRLLQGDVGSGKTVVAALAALQCVENGCQVAVMAPTEILAEQHYHQFSRVARAARACASRGSRAASRARRSARRSRAVAEGSAQIAIGTHALIQEEVRVREPRASPSSTSSIASACTSGSRLRMKGARAGAGAAPHQLMMSATPIPRTMAMSYYADLDVSVIDELPPGRTPVATRLVAEPRRARGDPPRARRVHGRQPGLLGLPADRGSRESAAEPCQRTQAGRTMRS